MLGFLKSEIFGHEVLSCCEHWQGGQGREAFNHAANRVSQHGGRDKKTLLLGDFNATSSWRRERRPHWQRLCHARSETFKLEQKGYFHPILRRWVVDTRQIDKLRKEFGYRDMGEEANDPTPTTHPQEGSRLRIDRIFRSIGFPGRVTAYTVAQPSWSISDHAYVHGEYEIPYAA